MTWNMTDIPNACFMWISWGFMVLSLIATFAWLHLQPLLQSRAQSLPPSVETKDTFCSRLTLEKKEQYLRVCIKLSLAFSTIFAVMYFVILITL